MVNNCPSLELASIVQSLTDSIESSVEPTNLRKTSPPVLRGGSFLWNQACANDQQNLLYRGPRYNTEIGQGPVFRGGRFPGTLLRPGACKFCYTADRGIINVRQKKHCMRKGRIIAAVFLSPVICCTAVNLVFSLFYYVQQRLGPPPLPNTMVFPDPTKPFEFVMLFSIYGIPTALITLAIFWLPCFLALRKRGKSSPAAVFLLSVILSLPALLVFQAFRAGPFLVSFLLMHGLAVGFGFVWLSGLGFTTGPNRKEPNQSPQPTRPTGG